MMFNFVLKKVKPTFGKDTRKSRYVFTNPVMDFWYYFMHKSLELTVENAVICFVTSRYWIKSKGASKLIRHLHSDATILQIVDFGKLKVFDSVVGLHMISLIQKGHKLINCNYYKIDNDVANIKSRNFSEQRIIQHNQIISNNENRKEILKQRKGKN